MAEMKTIFLVDDNMTNLVMGKNFLKDVYKTFTMPSACKMFDLLSKIKPDLILLDVEMPEVTGYDAIKTLKAGADANIPVIFLSAHTDAESMNEGLALGAIDYITKPFTPELLIERIEKVFK